MVGAVLLAADAGTSAEIVTAAAATASAVVVAAVPRLLAEAACNEIAISRIVKKAATRPSITINTSLTSKAVTILRGGGSGSGRTETVGIATKWKKKQPRNPSNNNSNNDKKNDLSTRGKAVACMALGMAFHYLG